MRNFILTAVALSLSGVLAPHMAWSAESVAKKDPNSSSEIRSLLNDVQKKSGRPQVAPGKRVVRVPSGDEGNSRALRKVEVGLEEVEKDYTIRNSQIILDRRSVGQDAPADDIIPAE